jgi:hypothetical protein
METRENMRRVDIMSREKEKGYKGKRQFSDKLQPVMQINRIVVERQRRIRKINRSKLSRKIGSKETRERELVIDVVAEVGTTRSYPRNQKKTCF